MTQENDKMQSKRWLPYSLFIGIMDDPVEADRAKEDLVASGLGDEDVEVLDRAATHERINASAEGANILERIARTVWQAYTAGLQMKEVQEAADEGSRVILAHIGDTDVEKVRDILIRHGGRHLEYVDSNGTFTEMAA